LDEGGIPIGSVLVIDGKIVGRGHNRRVQKGSTILHAEMDCLENVGRLGADDYRKATLYSTLSSCVTQTYHGTVLIVAHAGVNRVILRHILGIPFEKIFEIEQPYAGVHLLVRNLEKKEWKEALHVKPL